AELQAAHVDVFLCETMSKASEARMAAMAAVHACRADHTGLSSPARHSRTRDGSINPHTASPLQEAMNITTKQHGALLVVTPDGPINQETTAAFATTASEATRTAAGRVAFDLARVPFIDSEGLEALLDAADRLESIGHTARLVHASDIVSEVLELVGVDRRFQYFVSLAEAAGALR
ncbi:MAG: STAS domain-containing protein, partial [Planctomycetota bacterium]